MIGLAVTAAGIVAVFTVLVCAAHIPGLRTWTGAAPLERDGGDES